MKPQLLVTALALLSFTRLFAAVDVEPIAKTWEVLPVVSAEASSDIPDLSPARWGKCVIDTEGTRRRYMFQPEAIGETFQPPSLDYDQAGWQKYHAAWLRARKYVPVEASGRQVIFIAKGMRARGAKLFVNGKKFGELDVPTAKVDITGAVKFGDRNEIVLLLDGGNRPDFQFEKIAPRLVIRDTDSVDDIYVNTSWRTKTMTAEIQVTVEKPKSIGVVVKVLDKDAKEIKLIRETYEVPEGTSVVRPSLKWHDPVLWDLGHGSLYTLKAEVRFGTKTVTYPDVKFGFRELWREGRKICLNGHEVNLHSVRDLGGAKPDARALAASGITAVDFRRTKPEEMKLDNELLESLSANGIGVLAPVALFDRNSVGWYAGNATRRDELQQEIAKAVRRYRNWPCFLVNYLGADVYSPKHPGDPAHFGDIEDGPCPKLMNELIAEARTVNSNVLYASDSDGSLGDLESAALVYDWAPTAEWEDRFSAWSTKGKVPFRVRDLRLPGSNDWYRAGRDCVTEILASFYGDQAYELEPDSISRRHRSENVDCTAHPLVRRFETDFLTRVIRAWRTFGVNAGIAGADDYAYKAVNSPFLGWIAGSPRITDRHHSYGSGTAVTKNCVMLWDGSRRRKFSVEWKVSSKSKKLASGLVEKELDPGVPAFVPIRCTAPSVKHKTAFTVSAKFYNDKGLVIGTDSETFEVLPEAPALPTAKKLNTAKTRVIEPFALKSAADLPWKEIQNGLKVLVLQQSAEVMKSLGFEVEDVVPRQLTLRDTVSPAFKNLDADDLREWYGQPRTEQTAKIGSEAYGAIVKRKTPQPPRWNYNNALCGLLVRTPDAVGYLPVIEGGFDGDYAAVIRRYVGKGEIIFSLLSTTDRVGINEAKGVSVTDPSATKTQSALYADLLQAAEPAHNRKIFASGDYAAQFAKRFGLPTLETGIVPNSVIICGPDSEMGVNDLVSAASRGSNVLVVRNRRLAEGLGLKLAPADPSNGVYRVSADPANPDLRSIGRNILRFRDRCVYERITEGGKSWTVDADGLFASRASREGGKIFVLQFDPFGLDERIKAANVYTDKNGKKVPVNNQIRKEIRSRVDLTIDHHRQLAARLLTLLGVGSGDGPLYSTVR